MAKIKIIIYTIISAYLFYIPSPLAAPGDILFEDDFETNLSKWTIDNSGGGNASIGTETSKSGSSLRIRWDTVSITSNSINTSVPAAELAIWVRRGDDAFSEDPDTDEDLVLEYLNNVNNWVQLETFSGAGTAGEIFDRTYPLPSNALHNSFQVRLTYLQGNGVDWDYWHVDDVFVTERGLPVISGLIGEWQFEELIWNGASNEVIDSSSNNLHLTAFSAATSNVNSAITGNPGTCSYGVFNGSVSFIQRDDDTSTADSLLDIPDNLTITIWINTNVIPTSGLKSIISKDENYEFHINTAGEIYWWWSWATLTTTGANLQIGQWHHIAVTWTSGEQIIYVDGVPRATSARTGSLILNNDPLQLGQDLDIAERFFDGYLDEVRIYENVLTSSEINQVMNETHPCTVSGSCTQFFIDKFDVSSYSNSDGSDSWAGDWVETNDDGLATSGRMLITSGELRMTNNIGGNTTPTIERELDLSGSVSAVLKVDLTTSNNLENNDQFEVSASADGGSNWTPLQTFSNDINNTYTYDITGYASPTTRIRFRVTQEYRANNEYIYLNNLSVTSVKNCGPDHFRIIHDGSGINCLRESITIRAEDSANSAVTDYSGIVDLSLSTSNGNWFILDNTGVSSDLAQGTLTDTAGDNDGIANYQFDTADQGTVVLYLQDTVAETANITASEGSIVDDDSEGNITFRPFGYVFSPDPINTQIAGRPFGITLTAAGQTPAQPECGVIEEYTGVKAVNLWSNAPTTTPTLVTVNGNNISINEAASAPQNITFNNGVASISTQYNDVGQISISAKDETGIGDPATGTSDEIIGGISPFTVRPFAYDITISGDPNVNTVNSSVYANSGNNFNTNIRSLLWQSLDDTDNDGVPDIGADLTNNGITPNIVNIAGSISLSPLAQIITNSNGVLSDTTVDFSEFSSSTSAQAGTTSVVQSWTEAGILTLNAITADYLGTGISINGSRTNIGRFIPAYFTFNNLVTTNLCGSYSHGGYLDGTNPGLDRPGQPFVISGQVQARSSLGNITNNYANLVSNDFTSGFIKFDKSAFDAAGIDNATNTTINTLNFGANLATVNLIDNNNGSINFIETNATYQFETIRQPLDLISRVSVTDSDGVLTSGNFDSNVVEQRLARLILQDSYGPEVSAIEMRILTEYYDGTSWTLNSGDNCTNYSETIASFVAGSYTGNLNSGETTISSIGAQTLLSGISEIGNGLQFTAPGANNYGSVQVNLDLSNQPWLQFDWDTSDGLNQLVTTGATLNFGYYRGSDRVIYWQEQ